MLLPPPALYSMVIALLLTFSITPATADEPFAWGWGLAGGLGNGSTSDQHTAAAVDTSGVLSGKTVTAIATSGYHTLAVTSDGKIYGWGVNFRGELGDGTLTTRTSPVAVDMSGALSGKSVVAVAASFELSVALTSDGLVFTWGDNLNGELGAGGGGHLGCSLGQNRGLNRCGHAFRGCADHDRGSLHLGKQWPWTIG
jgi:alpha-tubulin suppressor-like RCC1 family protein